MPRMIALCQFEYNGKLLEAGEACEAADDHIPLLQSLGFARLAKILPAGKLTKADGDKYTTRHMTAQ